LPHLDQNDDLVESFLFKHQGGYPDHFYTVLTVMLRSIGIPARLVAGFAPGEFNPFTGMYIVKNTDAYAMKEVYFPKYGWFAFDPIPNHPLIPPSIEEYQTFSVLRQF
ncbi:MAG: transglutaminase-like domain-containing protein, partial [Sphaerospermopsis kisseleviana]